MTKKVILALVAFGSTALADGTVGRKEVVGIKLGMTPEEVNNVLTGLSPSGKPVSTTISVLGTPKYVAEIDGGFTKGDERTGLQNFFSPPPLPSRLVSIRRISYYKNPMTVASLKAALKGKYGSPSFENNDGVGLFWALKNDGSPGALAKKVADYARLSLSSPNVGSAGIWTLVSYAKDRNPVDVAFLENYIKPMRESGVSIAVSATYQATNDLVSEMSVEVFDVEKSAESFERLVLFAKDADAKKSQQIRKNAEQVKPTL
jgi:hypothetical protein